jgi:hypothetical protein
MAPQRKLTHASAQAGAPLSYNAPGREFLQVTNKRVQLCECARPLILCATMTAPTCAKAASTAEGKASPDEGPVWPEEKPRRSGGELACGWKQPRIEPSASGPLNVSLGGPLGINYTSNSTSRTNEFSRWRHSSCKLRESARSEGILSDRRSRMTRWVAK